MATSTLSRTGIPTGSWKVDKALSSVGFAVKQMRIPPVRATFRQFDGALEIGEDLADSRVYGRVDAASVDSNQSRRDEHPRSPDFLSAESHPELRFRSKATEPVDQDSFRVVGDLSINGVTNEVELTAELGGIETGPDREERIGREVTGEVSRKAFGMKFDPPLQSGNVMIADKMRIVIDVAAVKEAWFPPPSAA